MQIPDSCGTIDDLIFKIFYPTSKSLGQGIKSLKTCYGMLDHHPFSIDACIFLFLLRGELPAFGFFVGLH